MISFTQLKTMFGSLSLNNKPENLARGGLIMNLEQKYLLQKYFSNEASFTISTVSQQQTYKLPSDYSKLKTGTLTIGNLRWNPTEITSRAEWDNLNVFPYYADIPSKFFIWQNEFQLWPIPSTGSTQLTYSGLSGSINGGDIVTIGSATGTVVSVSTSNSSVMSFTANLASGATSGTLSSPFAYPSGVYLIEFSDGETKNVTFANGLTTATWTGGLTSGVTTNFSTTINPSSGTIVVVPTPNTGTLSSGAFTTNAGASGTVSAISVAPGNIITFNYKRRIPDLSLEDAVAGTVSVSEGGTTVTGVTTAWIPTTNSISESRWIQIPQPKGDNLWYQVQSVDSATSLTLYQPYQGVTVATSPYTLGQMPILIEDFHDMLVYKALVYYFTSIVDNKVKREEFTDEYNKKLELLAEYGGTKTVNVNLSRHAFLPNPNLFPQSIGGQ